MATFVRMEDAGIFNVPKHAELVHAGTADALKRGDHIKFTVHGGRHLEKFWAEFLGRKDGQLVVRVDNDMVLTGYHGLQYNDIITVDPQFICFVLKG